jgi:hypothetical protein
VHNHESDGLKTRARSLLAAGELAERVCAAAGCACEPHLAKHLPGTIHELAA